MKLSFVAGNLPVVMLDLDSAKTKSAYYNAAADVFKQLHPDQQPNLSFVSSLEKLTLPPNMKIVSLGPLDHLVHLPHLIHPDTHYNLLSKRGLAYSGLPTPETSVIETIFDGNVTYAPEQLNQEANRMVGCIEKRALPFVVKTPQAIGGLGTFLIHTETERHQVKEVLRVELQQMLQDLNPLNRHLHPCCLVVQELIPGESMGISFSVTQKGQAIFIGCTTQFFADGGKWVGGSICYPDQPRLEREYSATIDRITKHLHDKGYYGAVGADVVTDPSGHHLIVDLNVRVSGSYSLGCLKNYFGARGLSYAGLDSFQVHCSQSHFRRHFAERMKDGSLILNAWTPLPDGSSLGSIIIAAPDHRQFQEYLAEIKSAVSMINHSFNN